MFCEKLIQQFRCVMERETEMPDLSFFLQTLAEIPCIIFLIIRKMIFLYAVQKIEIEVIETSASLSCSSNIFSGVKSSVRAQPESFEAIV